MTSLVYCALGKEHPCPKPNDVRGLLRFGEKSIHVQSLMTSVVYCVWEKSIHAQSLTSMVYRALGKEHPCPKPNDVRGLLRFGKRASMPKA